MIRPIMHDPQMLSIPSRDCTVEDLYLYEDLIDTVKAHEHECVGIAANMIGVKKNAIVFLDEDDTYTVMFNPQIIGTGDVMYNTEEGCISLKGKRKTRRYHEIDVMYLDRRFRQRTRRLKGFQAKIVQHELDHTKGILV